MKLENEFRGCGIIVAGGSGVRLGGGKKKQFIEVNGHTILAWAIRPFVQAITISEIVVVCPQEDIDFIRDDIIERYSISKEIRFVKGGTTRQESVMNGLKSVSPDVDVAAIHDAARPFVTSQLIDKLNIEAHKHGGAVPAVPATDSSFVSDGEFVGEYIDRNTLFKAQTPQAFTVQRIIDGHKKAINDNFAASDDAMIYTKYIGKVKIVEGEDDNTKITYSSDITRAEEFFQKIEIGI